MKKDILVEFADENYKLVSIQELNKMEDDAVEFDGFTGYRVAGTILYKKEIYDKIDELIRKAKVAQEMKEYTMHLNNGERLRGYIHALQKVLVEVLNNGKLK